LALALPGSSNLDAFPARGHADKYASPSPPLLIVIDQVISAAQKRGFHLGNGAVRLHRRCDAVP